MDQITETPAPQTIPTHHVGEMAEPLVPHFCGLPPTPEPEFSADLTPMRLRAIVDNLNKWVNGTVIHYYFFDGPQDGVRVTRADGSQEWRSWVGAEDQKEAVRAAFRRWKEVGIGLEFREVARREEAEVRIGFQQGDGSWSYIGRYCLQIGAGDRTMNFGWDIASGQAGADTALHEIGHAIGLPHEHQNPFAGIVWDEERVYAALAAPPNRWSRDKTHYNIIRKLSTDEVQGSEWDPDSVMHYPFGAGLILQPEPYRGGIRPAGGLSARDQAWVRQFYPSLEGEKMPELKVGLSAQLALRSGQQQNFVIRPTATRHYDFRTFGSCDSVMVLFHDHDGELRFRAADDDSGEDRNAGLRIRLEQGRTYVLRIRLFFNDRPDPPSVMMW